MRILIHPETRALSAQFVEVTGGMMRGKGRLLPLVLQRAEEKQKGDKILKNQLRGTQTPGCWRIQSLRTRLFVFLTAISFFGVISLASVTPHAFAAVDPPACVGNACNGLDPYATFCAGQSWDTWSMLKSNPLKDKEGQQIGVVQLWRSTTCSTDWARIVFVSPGALAYAESAIAIDGLGKHSRFSYDSATRALLSPQYYALHASAAATGLVVIHRGNHTKWYAGCAAQNSALCWFL